MGRTNTPLAAPVLLSFALAAAFAIGADGGAVALAAWFQAATGPRFYPDDPVWVDDDRAFDAAKALPTATGDIYDFVEHTFLSPGERVDRPALNVNTLDEVPDSSWFTNRIGRRRLSRDELVRGPGSPGPAGHPGLADRVRQGRGRSARLSRPGSGEAPLADRVRSAVEPRDGLGGRGDRHGVLSRARLQRRRGLHHRRRSGEDPDRAQRADARRDGAQGRPLVRAGGPQRGAGAGRAPARRPRPRPRQPLRRRDRRSAASATTASAPTIPTTSSRTSTAASCAPTACSRPG